MKLTCLLLLVASFYLYCNGLTVYNVSPGVYGTKRESTGFYLSSTSTFKPIGALSTRIHVTNPATLFIHYQLSFYDSSCDFKSILQVNSFNAGSMVHIGSQQNYKTATGYYMAYINPGYYNIEVQYTASSSISESSSSLYLTSVINVMWFEGTYMASDGIKCYPSAPSMNTYKILSPIRYTDAVLYTPSNRVILAAYQFSAYTSSSSGYMMARIKVNDQQIKSTTMINQGYFVDFSGLWMKYHYDGEYHFGLTYRNSYSSYFEDCRNSYKDNKNIFATTLPSRCSMLCNDEPTTTWYYSASSWRNTDLSCTFSLSQDSHLLIRYQFSTPGRSTYTITSLVFNNVLQPHTTSVRGAKSYSGNTGFWQGVLSSGTYTITVQVKSGSSYYHYVAGSSYEEYARAMEIVRCY